MAVGVGVGVGLGVLAIIIIVAVVVVVKRKASANDASVYPQDPKSKPTKADDTKAPDNRVDSVSPLKKNKVHPGADPEIGLEIAPEAAPNVQPKAD